MELQNTGKRFDFEKKRMQKKLSTASIALLYVLLAFLKFM
jgi:hypothetical protein